VAARTPEEITHRELRAQSSAAFSNATDPMGILYCTDRRDRRGSRQVLVCRLNETGPPSSKPVPHRPPPIPPYFSVPTLSSPYLC